MNAWHWYSYDRGLKTILQDDLHWLNVHERIQYKLGVMEYVADHIIQASGAAPPSRLHRKSCCSIQNIQVTSYEWPLEVIGNHVVLQTTWLTILRQSTIVTIPLSHAVSEIWNLLNENIIPILYLNRRLGVTLPKFFFVNRLRHRKMAWWGYSQQWKNFDHIL